MNMLGSNFSWRESQWLLALIALPVIYFLLFRAEKIRRVRLDFLNRSVGDLMVWRVVSWKTSLKQWLFIFSIAGLVISLAGPRLGWRLNEVQQNGMDIVVAIDVSKSMLSQDVQPSRLERARRMVLELIEVAPGDRIGLVLFAGAAYVQCPLTFDHEAVRTFLSDLDPELVPIGGTDLSAALRESLRALGAGAQNANFGLGKLIVLLSDGENQQGDLEKAIGEVQRSEAKVISVAMGTEAGAPVPNMGGGLVKDEQGRVVISKLDDKGLRFLAEKTGGHFVSGAGREMSVAEIYQTFFRESGIVKDQKVIKEKEWFDRYQWVAAIALLLLFIDLFLVDLKRCAAVLPLCFVLSLAWPTSVEASDREEYNRAVESFGAASSENVEKVFQKLRNSSDDEVARRSLYNLGNLLAKQGRFDEAVKAYEEALRLNVQDQQVRDNLAWAKKNQQKSDQQKSDQQKSDQQKSDQQKSDQQKSDQQKSDQQKSDQQKSDDPDESDTLREIDTTEAERLLRSVPEEPRRVAPVHRGGGLPQQKSRRDW